MSRHNKWSKIKGKKGAADAKRAIAFTKFSRAITLAAKEGGTDPVMNFKLRLAVDAARAQNMPKDTIDRAIARGAGTGEGGDLNEVMFEAFGPGGVALLVEAVTDNNNRTSSNIKAVLSKHGARLGGPGSVAWQFDRQGVIRISPSGGVSDELELELIEAGAKDIRSEEGGFTIQVAPEALKTMMEFLEKKKIVCEHSDLAWIPKTTVALGSDDQEKLEKIIEVLEDDEDVTSVSSNDA